ncbi:enoyl-CoA hydratase/isomerase family protein [Aromatoleum toluclasticum]|uniref:enoyl-CoA hydratase/isomerase family protein n=1 Tax=Aromatoleum toluclasticum TaxID=92003 RepID=UPI001D1873B5|nr:enoyl-CoA hydratase/isomerase family protein [Aromatoleum toluclasticum]MCC4117528.1 enoyl-CoA hydratase/isomerase family protein [Aromatoleum toluclasticum]
MPDGDPAILDLAGLRALRFASAGGAGGSPFAPDPFLVVAPIGADESDEDLLAAWLARQPCPVIGLSVTGAAPALLAACDLVLDELADLAPLAANIRKAPLAAMTLVQVLRVTQGMPAAQAVAVESLAYATLQAGPEFAAWSRGNPPAPERIVVEDGPAVRIERDGSRLGLTLNRPLSRNPMSVEMRDALWEALELVVADESIASVTLLGAGACFSVGGELREFGTAPDPATAHAVRSQRLPAALLLQCADRATAHLHSACIGSGIELPAFAHRLTATRDTFVQLPELRFGLIPGAGGCVSLPRRIGRQRTAWLALSGRRVGAATALAWGLVDEIVDQDEAHFTGAARSPVHP